jgi:hypothetical protein
MHHVSCAGNNLYFSKNQNMFVKAEYTATDKSSQVFAI